ncbi:hypothetical protein ACFQH1_00340 [Lactiplantibacillus daoliensis]|uniref:WxL domain-containing protein n=1 Tax=Lactiplantibacillus daoliensis TaxID=2559916 RepID=A0ABW1UEN6_9LACO|nr:hypothetical protein [Lactiplantibacillus daoliensis]
MRVKIVKQILVLVIFSFTFAFNGLAGQAATDEMKDVMKNGTFFVQNNVEHVQVSDGLKDNQAYLLQGKDFKLLPQWILKGVKANYVDKNGRLTVNTKKIEITVRGRMTSHDNNGKLQFNFAPFNFALLSKKSGKWSPIPATNNPRVEFKNTDLVALDGVSSGKVITFEVENLSNLRDLLPLKVGFSFDAVSISKTNPSYLGTVVYSLGTFKAGQLNAPTIKDPVTPQTQIIEGTGTAGNRITSNINSEETIVDANGNYKLDLKENLEKSLIKDNGLTITESNLEGDAGSKTINQVSLLHAEQDQAFDLEDSVDLTSDNIADVVAKKAHINAENTSNVVFKSSYSEEKLNALIGQLKQGGTIEIPIYAQKNGYIQSKVINVKVTKSVGALAFNQSETTLEFGQQQIPMVPTRIYPDRDFKITVDDHRSKKIPWQISAVAKGSNSSLENDLTPFLYYVDEHSQSQSLGSSTIVYQKGKDTTDQETEILFSGTNKNKDSVTRSLFVKAMPNMKIAKYSTTIVWTLADVPY